MASVPNRVYPLAEYNAINTINVTASGTISGSKIVDSSLVKGLTIDTGAAMSLGEYIIYTGATGTTAFYCVKIASGSTSVIWTAALTYGGIATI